MICKAVTCILTRKLQKLHFQLIDHNTAVSKVADVQFRGLLVKVDSRRSQQRSVNLDIVQKI